MSASRSRDDPAAKVDSPAANGLALQLRYWRGVRGLSQLQLALESGISSRHLSFLETGRSKASEETVGRLAEALRLSPADRACMQRGNAGLGGRPPPPDASTREGLRRAVDVHSPYPALLADSVGTLQHVNPAMDRLLAHVRGEPATSNLFEVFFAPWGFRALVEEEARLAPALFAQVRRDLLALCCPEAMEVLRRISRLAPDLARLEPASVAHEARPVVEIAVRLGDRRLRLSSMYASPGSEEAGSRTDWRIETIVPLDDETAAFFTA